MIVQSKNMGNKTNEKKFDPFKNLVLDTYEQEIEDSFDLGEWKPVENQEEWKEQWAAAAARTLSLRESKLKELKKS